MKSLGCDYEAPTFGAPYPDGTCIEGYMYDLDSCDDEGNLYGDGDIPCPHCNTSQYLDYLGLKGAGNSRQRRAYLRKEARKCVAWAKARSTFNLN